MVIPCLVFKSFNYTIPTAIQYDPELFYSNNLIKHAMQAIKIGLISIPALTGAIETTGPFKYVLSSSSCMQFKTMLSLILTRLIKSSFL